MPRTINFQHHFDSLIDSFGTTIDTPQLQAYCNHHGVGYQTITKYLQQYKVGRGKWNLTVEEAKQQLERSVDNTAALSKTVTIAQNLVPAKDDTFVSFGNFSSLKKVIQSRQFYPVFITGLSGNGKTFAVEQACAQLNRELIRVNITIETDEDDLIGGFRLVNGETVWHNGPVIEALERGAVLLLDEIDLASNKVLCLQSILEGKGIFLKKIGEYIKPTAGFTVIATANTKGKGSDDGRFIGTNVLNEAFLERFPITFEQQYPTVSVENRILERACEELNVPLVGEHKDFIVHLCNWADIVRKTFNDGGIDEVISTRRLVHIIRAYSIFGDKMKAVELCLNRFDDETKQSFLELYSKLDETVNLNEEQSEDANMQQPPF